MDEIGRGASVNGSGRAARLLKQQQQHQSNGLSIPSWSVHNPELRHTMGSVDHFEGLAKDHSPFHCLVEVSPGIIR